MNETNRKICDLCHEADDDDSNKNKKTAEFQNRPRIMMMMELHTNYVERYLGILLPARYDYLCF